MFIQTQPTPNPATLKFLPGEDVSPATPYEFISQDEAAASPLASALFGINGVKGVFLGADFVSITKAEDADWAVLKPQVVGILLDHFVSQAPLFAGGDASGISVPAETDDDPADAEVDVIAPGGAGELERRAALLRLALDRALP